LTVNAVTTFASSSGPVTVNAPVVANDGLTVAGNTVIGSSAASGQSLTINAVTTFSVASAPITANAALTANSDVTVNGQLTSNGNTVLGKAGGSQTLTVNSVAAAFTSTAANALTVAGSTVLGTSGGSQSLTVNAAVTSFTSTASNAVIVAGTFTAAGNTILGTANGSQSMIVNAANAVFTSAASNAVTVAGGLVVNGNASLLGNTTIGTNSSNVLLVYANTTFNNRMQLYSNSSSAAHGAVLGFQRQNSGSAVSSGFTLGSILFSAYDGSVQGPTAQIRSQFTVSLLPLLVHLRPLTVEVLS